MYTPDKWVIVRIGDVYKLLGGTSGGYLDGDSWRLNSGIVDIEKKKDHYLVHGYSGSVYKCYKGRYGTNMMSHSILMQLKEAGASALENVDEYLSK